MPRIDGHDNASAVECLAVDFLLARFDLGRLELKRERLVALVMLVTPVGELLFERLHIVHVHARLEAAPATHQLVKIPTSKTQEKKIRVFFVFFCVCVYVFGLVYSLDSAEYVVALAVNFTIEFGLVHAHKTRQFARIIPFVVEINLICLSRCELVKSIQKGCFTSFTMYT